MLKILSLRLAGLNVELFAANFDNVVEMECKFRVLELDERDLDRPRLDKADTAISFNIFSYDG